MLTMDANQVARSDLGLLLKRNVRLSGSAASAFNTASSCSEGARLNEEEDPPVNVPS